jgi:hypothetical protein
VKRPPGVVVVSVVWPGLLLPNNPWAPYLDVLLKEFVVAVDLPKVESVLYWPNKEVAARGALAGALTGKNEFVVLL